MWKLTDSEWKVLEALWAGGPQHLGQILGALAPETGWSRTTVHTYLTRMAAKGLVSMDQSSPRRYAAIPSRETCAPPGSGGIWWTGSMTARRANWWPPL